MMAAACASQPPAGGTRLDISGSDTMLILNRQLAEGFMRANPGVSVTVAGGGTATGFDALVADEIDICAASRPMAPGEVQTLFEAQGVLGVRFLIAQDPLSIWVHPTNPVRDLTMDQLDGVFSGGLRSWSALGGEDREISVVIRSPASGTHRFFRDRVLRGGAYSTRALTAAGTFDVVQAVAADPSAIGYGGVAYRQEGVRVCAVEGKPPSAMAVGQGRYPLTRHLVFYTAAPPAGLNKRFIDWCQGPQGQAVVEKVGYLSLWGR